MDRHFVPPQALTSTPPAEELSLKSHQMLSYMHVPTYQPTNGGRSLASSQGRRPICLQTSPHTQQHLHRYIKTQYSPYLHTHDIQYIRRALTAEMLSLKYYLVTSHDHTTKEQTVCSTLNSPDKSTEMHRRKGEKPSKKEASKICGELSSMRLPRREKKKV